MSRLLLGWLVSRMLLGWLVSRMLPGWLVSRISGQAEGPVRRGGRCKVFIFY